MFVSIYFQKNSKNIKFNTKDITKYKVEKKYDLIVYLAGMASPEIYKKFPLDDYKKFNNYFAILQVRL